MPQLEGEQIDSEDDSDYVPLKDDSDRSDDESDSGAEEAPGEPSSLKEESEAEKQKQREALWSSFQASVATTATTSQDVPQPKQKIKIQKKYRFAGEDVLEVVEVDEDSADAKKWPLWQPATTEDDTTLVDKKTDTPPVQDTVESAKTSNPTSKKPGPRRPKTLLANVPQASKAKKISTLDKSAMDWRQHIQSEQNTQVLEELEAHRRGGGYLEKVEFLNRVEERKEENLDTLRTTKRRRTQL